MLKTHICVTRPQCVNSTNKPLLNYISNTCFLCIMNHKSVLLKEYTKYAEETENKVRVYTFVTFHEKEIFCNENIT